MTAGTPEPLRYNERMQIQPRLSRIKPSATLALATRAKAMKAAGEDVISLAAGEPDFAPPSSILDGVQKALKDGRTKYTPSAGIPELRTEIATHLKVVQGLDVTADNIVVSAGGKQALHNVFQALLAPGDEVLVPAPYWVSYPALIDIAEATPVFVEAPTQGFIDFDRLREACTDKTRMIMLNSPNNPSGRVISAAELDAFETFVIERDLLVVSDELYADLVYGESTHQSPGARPKLAERTITIGGFSKSYALTGWRLGWSVTPVDVAKAIGAYQSHTTSNANSLAQYAVLGALSASREDVARMLAAFDVRRRLIVEGLNAIPGITCEEPQGAFYAFPDITGLMEKLELPSDVDLCEHILDTLKVVCVPGSAFGAPGHMRLSYAAGDEVLQQALARLAEHFA